MLSLEVFSYYTKSLKHKKNMLAKLVENAEEDEIIQDNLMYKALNQVIDELEERIKHMKGQGDVPTEEEIH